MTLSRDDIDSPPAQHFGKAKWLLVTDGSEKGESIRNEGLNGRWVAEAFASRGCTDVIADHLGAGAYAHVTAAGMRVWKGEPGQSARELATALVQGRLLPFEPDALGQGQGHGHDHHHAHGCGC